MAPSACSKLRPFNRHIKGDTQRTTIYSFLSVRTNQKGINFEGELLMSMIKQALKCDEEEWERRTK